MAIVPQETLTDHQEFLMNIGYLAVINGGGPFSGRFPQSAIGQFNIRENIADVAIGDQAYNGAEWGIVTAKSGDANGYKFTVQYAHTILPGGVPIAEHNPVRNQEYTAMLPAAADVSGKPTNNAWQKLASLGVLIVQAS